MTVPFAHQRRPALLLTLLLHLGLFASWQLSRPPPVAAPGGSIHWLTLLTARRPPPLPDKPPLPRQPNRQPPAVRAAPPSAALVAPAAVAEAVEAALPVVAPLESSGKTAADIMRQARRDLGKIDRELRDADAKWVRTPVSTPHSRMMAAFEAAREAVPPKWYEAARITPIGDQSGNGPRLYKVQSAFGTYCIKMGTNHSIEDTMGKRIEPQIINCPH